jgi:hypothetical protein
VQNEAPQTNGSDGAIPAEIGEISREELLARVDRGAKGRLGLSGWEEFADMYRHGELPDTLAVNELGILLDTAEQSVV